MKNIKAILLVTIIITALIAAGCSGNDKLKESPEPRPGTVSLLLPYAETDALVQNDTQQKLIASFDDAAREQMFVVTHIFADGDAARQAAQLTETADAGTGVIVVVPVSGADLSEGLAAADKAGVPVIALHESIEGADTLSAVVAPDYKEAVTKLIDAAQTAHPDTGILFLNGGPQGDKTADAIGGYIGSDYRTMTAISSDWTFAGGRNETAQFIKGAGAIPSAVVAMNASMASGAARAIADAKLSDKVGLYALNPSGLNADMITSGKAAAVAVPDTDAEAKQAIALCAELIANKEVELNHLIPFLIIDTGTIEAYLNKPAAAETPATE
ncbi:MAG: substrate-binding domain-containing protein [Clostridiales Family XIII bacterium]|nr:substrate-binding domain-containing protein [Clostridiales Family XIII bacterium]